jgi:hypothetical protein
MKRAHHHEYGGQDTERAESALLTAWAVLADFQEDLVLIGGLVPRYLCHTPPHELQPVTVDVDMGIALGISSGLYEPLAERLAGAGFVFKNRRFQKVTGAVTLYLDLLTDRPGPDAPENMMVDTIPVSTVYGLQRALDVCREVIVRGRDLYGGEVEERIRVCEIGPYLCLKLLAYAGRHQSKDVFDIVRTARNYDVGGVETAVRCFHAEQGINAAYDIAMRTLQKEFSGTGSKGPVQYADFCLGSAKGQASDATFLRQQRMNEAFDVAYALLARPSLNPDKEAI